MFSKSKITNLDITQALRLGVKCKQCRKTVITQNDTAYNAAQKHGILCDECRGNVAKKWTKSAYADYLKTEHWQTTRDKALKRAGHKCQLCSATSNLHVHHNTYERLGGELPTDLVVLCNECHKTHHGIL